MCAHGRGSFDTLGTFSTARVLMKFDEETWARIYPWLEKAQDVPAADLREWIAQIISERPEVGIPLSDVLSQASSPGWAGKPIHHPR